LERCERFGQIGSPECERRELLRVKSFAQRGFCSAVFLIFHNREVLLGEMREIRSDWESRVREKRVIACQELCAKRFL